MFLLLILNKFKFIKNNKKGIKMEDKMLFELQRYIFWEVLYIKNYRLCYGLNLKGLLKFDKIVQQLVLFYFLQFNFYLSVLYIWE